MTKVIILAAGQGTRLRPYTENKPKCMVEFAGKTLLQHQIDLFKEANINDINLVGGYHADKLPANYPTFVNAEYANTNMVYSLFKAADIMNAEDDIIISYGDIIFSQHVLSKLLTSNKPIAIVTDMDWKHYWQNRMQNILDDVETFKWNEESGLVSELGKKPKAISDVNGQYIGLIKLSKDYVNKFKSIYDAMDRNATYDGKDFSNMYMTSFLQYIIDLDASIYGLPIKNNWLEFDTVSDLNAYNDAHKRGDFAWIN